MGDCEIVSVDGLSKFFKKFALPQEDMIQYNVNSVVDLPEFFEMKFEQYNVDIRIHNMLYNFVITASCFEKNEPIRKLKITGKDSRFKQELLPCINHLQRRRDLLYAIHILAWYSRLHSQRESIGTFMIQKLGPNVNLVYNQDDIFRLDVIDTKKDCFYFQLTWKLYWTLTRFEFLDYLDFSINKENQYFYTNAKPCMQILVQSRNNFKVMLEAWQKLALYVLESMRLQEDVVSNHTNVEAINNTIDITNSDNEDDVILVDNNEINLD